MTFITLVWVFVFLALTAFVLFSDLLRMRYVEPLSDMAAIELLVKLKGYSPAYANTLVASCRRCASDHKHDGIAFWRVKAGYTVREHAAQDKNCRDSLQYVKYWNLPSDVPTKDSIVCWVPRLALDSTNKTICEMQKIRERLLESCNLSEPQDTEFGSIGLLFALINAHHKLTGERVPLALRYAVSDSTHGNSGHLMAGSHSEGNLNLGHWDGSARADVGFFFLLVIELD